VSAPQPTQPGRSGQSAQLAQLATIAPAFFSGPELRRERAAQNPEPKRFRTATIEIVSGAVTEVTDAMTWVVGGQIIHLWGIRPGPRILSPFLTSVAARVIAEGPINCRRQAHSTRYRCSTATGEDVAETELLSGIGRAADGATAYLSAEAQTRRKNTGLRPRP